MVSATQLYNWIKQTAERKPRACKKLSETVATVALMVVRTFPHFSGAKGQLYMSYHQLGYISQAAYKKLKKAFKRVISQEVTDRKLRAKPSSYVHERADNPGEIWAEDFTKVTVEGKTYPLALLIDVASLYFLGCGGLRAGGSLPGGGPGDPST